MRLFLSIFLLFTLVASVTVVVMQQVQTAIECEFKENKNADDSTTEEKENKSEKDLFAYKHTSLHFNTQEEANRVTHLVLHHDESIKSSLYNTLPFNPPEI